MNSTKPWYSSAGVWGALVSLTGSAAALLKIELDPELLDDVREWVLALATLIGGAVALWGRIRASRRIAGSAAGPDDPGNPAPGNDRTVLTRTPIILAALGAGIVVVVVISASGCACIDPGGAYIAADRATHDAIAPEYRAYVQSDPALDPDQRARRDRTLETWRLRLEDAETRLASEPAKPLDSPTPSRPPDP